LEVATGQEVRTFSEDAGIFDLAVSPDGQQLLTANKATGKVRLSNATTGLEAHDLPE
jgi:WD40 repeat protein